MVTVTKDEILRIYLHEGEIRERYFLLRDRRLTVWRERIREGQDRYHLPTFIVYIFMDQ